MHTCACWENRGDLGMQDKSCGEVLMIWHCSCKTQHQFTSAQRHVWFGAHPSPKVLEHNTQKVSMQSALFVDFKLETRTNTSSAHNIKTRCRPTLPAGQRSSVQRCPTSLMFGRLKKGGLPSCHSPFHKVSKLLYKAHS